MNIRFNANAISRSIIEVPSNTSDLVNGLFLTMNTVSQDFDYADAYNLLPLIIEKVYECIGTIPFSLKLKTVLATKHEIDTNFIGGQLLIVCSLGLNKNGEKVHIHMWIYNLHSYNIPFTTFRKNLNSKIKSISGISSRNEFAVKLCPCTDEIDKKIRDANYDNQVLIDYIKNCEYNTLMNYFKTKNDKNFLYFY